MKNSAQADAFTPDQKIYIYTKMPENVHHVAIQVQWTCMYRNKQEADLSCLVAECSINSLAPAHEGSCSIKACRI